MVCAGIVAVLVIALGACSGGSSSQSTGTTTSTTKPAPRTTASTRPQELNLLLYIQSLTATVTPTTTPYKVPPGGCPAARTSTVELKVNDSGLTPRCIAMTVTQSLEIRNTGDLFHNVTIADLSANVDAGEAQPFGRVGRYLGPGTYQVSSITNLSSAYSGALVITR
jgi:hypothetical protein